MSSFNTNFQSLIGLKSRQVGLQENQQTFDQDRTKQFMPMELDQARVGVDKARVGVEQDRFGLERARGFLPFELGEAKIGMEKSQFGLDKSRQLLPYEVNQAQIGVQRSQFDLNRSQQLLPSEIGQANLGLQRSQFALDTDKKRQPHQLRMEQMDGQSRAMSLTNQAYSSMNTPGSYNFLQQDRNMAKPLGYASGGPVQDVQPRGFVPVRVSNGEYEFTPEQVTAIGAAMLAAQSRGAGQ